MLYSVNFTPVFSFHFLKARESPDPAFDLSKCGATEVCVLYDDDNDNDNKDDDDDNSNNDNDDDYQ